MKHYIRNTIKAQDYELFSIGSYSIIDMKITLNVLKNKKIEPRYINWLVYSILILRKNLK